MNLIGFNSAVIREKPDGPRDLNKVIKREHHPVSTVDDITLRLCGATLFSKCEDAQGYWKFPLAKESQALMTFNMQKGRHKFFRMPFVLRMPQDIFQRKIDQTYDKYQSAAEFADIYTSVW